jgi:hypothetical protein
LNARIWTLIGGNPASAPPIPPVPVLELELELELGELAPPVPELALEVELDVEEEPPPLPPVLDSVAPCVEPLPLPQAPTEKTGASSAASKAKARVRGRWARAPEFEPSDEFVMGCSPSSGPR